MERVCVDGCRSVFIKKAQVGINIGSIPKKVAYNKTMPQTIMKQYFS